MLFKQEIKEGKYDRDDGHKMRIECKAHFLLRFLVRL